MGITRVANVTGGLSGIPVVMVSRPNSRSVAVCREKELIIASARASGLMEATELYHAATITLPLRLAAYEELRYQHKRCPNRRSSTRLRFAFSSIFALLCTKVVISWAEERVVLNELFTRIIRCHCRMGHGCSPASSNGLLPETALVEAISQGSASH